MKNEYKVSKEQNAELPKGGKGSVPRVPIILQDLKLKDKLTVHMPKDQARTYINAIRQKVYRHKKENPNTNYMVHLIDEGIGVWRTK
jgi:hypothetical protein